MLDLILLFNLWSFGENQCEIIYNHEDEVITRSIGHAHIDGSLGLFKECVLCCSVAVHFLIRGANNKIVTIFFFRNSRCLATLPSTFQGHC